MNARRASSTKAARAYRQRGHDDALKFALAIGMKRDYARDQRAKKDVIDPAGDAHSVKSGRKKWQIFLYSRRRFLEDDGFQALNGVGSLLVHCIDAFPPRYSDYVDNQAAAKERLKTPMRELRDRFQRKALLRAFLRKSIFNGGEVNYLTILHEDRYCVYWSDDVVRAMADAFEVVNSTARNAAEFDDQKVLFRYEGRNVGELEMRNDSEGHYGEVRFNMNKEPCIALLNAADLQSQDYSRKGDSRENSQNVVLYGQAMTKFGKWMNA